MTSRIRTRAIAALIAASSLLAAQEAAATQTCFTWGGGKVHLQFAGTLTAGGLHPLTGVAFGPGLTNCAGLTHWGVYGSAFTKTTGIVMGFRIASADAGACGAVDFTASLDPATMSGPLQLYNERAAYGSSDTLVAASCKGVPNGPAAPSFVPVHDAQGNCSGAGCQAGAR